MPLSQFGFKLIDCKADVALEEPHRQMDLMLREEILAEMKALRENFQAQLEARDKEIEALFKEIQTLRSQQPGH